MGRGIATAHRSFLQRRTQESLRLPPQEDGRVRDDGVQGAALSRAYFHDLIRPTLATAFPGLPHAAGRLGSGSDVLGLDDVTSRDHDWGPRLDLIVPGSAVEDVIRVLEGSLPDTFDGLPTRFAFTGETRPRLHVDVTSMRDLVQHRLGFDPRVDVTVHDWLSLSGQAALEVTAGPVFADTDGELQRVRAALAWYPADLWRYVLACDWARIAQELPSMSRAADVGDDPGSRIIAARLAHGAVHLAFVLERRWPPYAKWFGTLFRTLRCAPEVGPCIDAALVADDGPTRARSLAAALQHLLALQNALGLTDVARATVPFWDRPHIHPDPAIVTQLLNPIGDPAVRALPLGRGTIEQRTDNVDVLVDPRARRRATQD